MRFRTDRRRGAALILSLLLLVVLVAVITQLRLHTTLESRIARNYRGDVQNTYAVRAGINYAKLFLKSDLETAGDVDTLHETWARTFDPILIGEDVELRLWIEDEERKFNLNSVVSPQGAVNQRAEQQFERLLAILRIAEPSLVKRLVDYIDKDSEGMFENNAKNNFLFTVRELRRLEGYTDAVLFGGDGPSGTIPIGLASRTTVWTDGKINVNTASAEVLQALDAEMTREFAQAIVMWRQGGPPGKGNMFRKLPEDLANVPGLPESIAKRISSSLVVKSSVFLVHLRSRRGRIERRMQAVLRRDQGIARLVAVFHDQSYKSLGIEESEDSR